MSRLDSRKSRLTVEFSETIREHGRHREVTMELSPYGVTVRLKGLRTRFVISPAAIYNRAVLLEVERRRAEKKASNPSTRRRSR